MFLKLESKKNKKGGKTMPDRLRRISTAIRNDLEIFRNYLPAGSEQPQLVIRRGG
jgi:hypothetical protein